MRFFRVLPSVLFLASTTAASASAQEVHVAVDPIAPLAPIAPVSPIAPISPIAPVLSPAPLSAVASPAALPPGTTEVVILAPPPPPPPKPFAVSFGLEGGLAYFTENTPFGTDSNIGLGLAPGYNLGLRASFEFFRWLALDARGVVMHNDGNAYVNYGSITTVGGLGAARFTLPVPHIRPYALLGFGGYHVSATSGGSTTAKTQLLDDTVSAIEFGLGAVVPTGNNVEVGVEWRYSHLNNELLATNPNANGGDPSTVSFFVQYRLPL